MPSLFSRSRTNSTPKKQDAPVLDEFGRIDKRAARPYTPDVPPPIPDGSFLPLNLDPPRTPAAHDYGYLAYQRHVVLGLEQVSRLVIVISDELGTRGGITTPFIFSTTALDISSSAIKKLIQAFLATCKHQSGQSAAAAESRWRDEARFAGPHELGMCLRWGLARAVRSVGAQDVRGLLSWDRYLEFRNSEAAQGFPPAHFATLLHDLDPVLQTVLITLLTLLSRLTANSTSSGHTPPTLSPLFGPLIFGLGPATLAFHHTYTHYLRAVNAMEHLQLVFIRWQDATSTAALGVPVRLKEWIKGYPAMLPFLQDPASTKKPQARRGVRTVRVMSVRRNVRMYSPDLVKTAASWAYSAGPTKNALLVSKEWARIAPPTLKLPPRYSDAYRKRMDMPAHFHPDTGVLSAPALNATSSSSSYGSSITSSSGTTDTSEYFGLGLNTRTGDDRFRSLTDLKWGEFESMGFGNLEDEKKLQFDLTESARTERSAKRESLSWTDFSSTGFTRSDAPLSATLQFSTPVAKTISAWPAHNAELAKKLKKTEKALPPFGWDTEPVVVSEEVIEEAFVDVFCDLVYGGGWMDLERSEEVDRDCNWALVEFKSMPVNRTTASGLSDPRTGTSLILFEEFVPLEYRHQLSLPPSTRRRLPSLFSSIPIPIPISSNTKSKPKPWKQAPTLNGRPYVVGHVPHSPTYREVEFEEILRGDGGTKVIRLEGRASVKVPPPSRVSMPPEVPLLPLPLVGAEEVPPVPPVPESATPKGKPSISGPLYAPAPARAPSPVPVPAPSPVPASASVPEPRPRPRPVSISPAPQSDEQHSDSTKSKSPPASVTSTKRSSRFRLPVPVASPASARKGVRPAEYSSVEFETRLAGWSDEEAEGAGLGLGGGKLGRSNEKGKGRERDDDAWVDILVGSQRRRMGAQEAERRLDPNVDVDVNMDGDQDGGSMEAAVARVLAGVRERERGGTPESVRESGRERERVDRDPEGGLDALYRVHGGDGHGEEGEGVRTSEESEYTMHTEEHEEDHEEEHEAEHEDEELIQQTPTPSPISARLLAKTQRRMGYFDLHPERRQGVKAENGKLKMQEDVEIRHVARLAYDVESEEDEDDRPLGRLGLGLGNGNGNGLGQNAQQQQQQGVRRLPVPPTSGPAPASVSVSAPVSAPPVIKIEPAKVEPQPQPQPASPNGNGQPQTPKSKTAALIEMYRERERATSPKPGHGHGSPTTPVSMPTPTTPTQAPSPIAPLSSSRLPVRSHSLPKDGVAAVGAASAPAPVPVPVPVPLAAPVPKVASPLALAPESPSPSPLIEPPRIGIEETGRASPGRYVHGAPLHNVMEEEEEE